MDIFNIHSLIKLSKNGPKVSKKGTSILLILLTITVMLISLPFLNVPKYSVLHDKSEMMAIFFCSGYFVTSFEKTVELLHILQADK